MSQMLGEAGALDIPVLQARVEAEIDKLRPQPPPPAPAVSASVAHPVKAPPPVTQVRCDRCGKTVASTHTTITANGTLCDGCAQS
jgi:hypothetical protein